MFSKLTKTGTRKLINSIRLFLLNLLPSTHVGWFPVSITPGYWTPSFDFLMGSKGKWTHVCKHTRRYQPPQAPALVYIHTQTLI